MGAKEPFNIKFKLNVIENNFDEENLIKINSLISSFLLNI